MFLFGPKRREKRRTCSSRGTNTPGLQYRVIGCCTSYTRAINGAEPEGQVPMKTVALFS